MEIRMSRWFLEAAVVHATCLLVAYQLFLSGHVFTDSLSANNFFAESICLLLVSVFVVLYQFTETLAPAASRSKDQVKPKNDQLHPFVFRPDADRGIEMGVLAAPVVFAAKVALSWRLDGAGGGALPSVGLAALSSGSESEVACFWTGWCCSMDAVALLFLSRRLRVTCLHTTALRLGLVAVLASALCPEWSLVARGGLTVLALEALLRIAFQLMPASFTFGEGVFAASSLAILAVDTVILLSDQEVRAARSPPLVFVQTLLSSVLVVAGMLAAVAAAPVEQHHSIKCPTLQATLWTTLLGGVFLVVIPALNRALGTNAFSWVLMELLRRPSRLAVCAYWIVLLAVTLVVLGVPAPLDVTYSPKRKHHPAGWRRRVPNIILRKAFHILALVMFCPPSILDAEFLGIAYAVGTAALVLVECVRASGVAPVARVVDRFMGSFLDQRDSGPVILTHLYLSIGCAVPLWLQMPLYLGSGPSPPLHDTPLVRHPPSPASILAPFAGLLILGVGDTMASLVGVNVGRLHWPNTTKSVEGTVGAVVSMLLSAAVVLSIGFSSLNVVAVMPLATVVALVGATAVACLMEAFTLQIDNLFLPVFYYALMCALC